MNRFVKMYRQGVIDKGELDVVEIWVDTKTGVNYMFTTKGNAGGLTPLLDRTVSL